jgi:hypothetical protein
MLAGDYTRYHLILVFLFSYLILQGCLFGDRVVTSSSPQSAIYRCYIQELLKGLLEKWFLVDMHVQPQWVNKLLFPSFVKDKQGEPAMMSHLAALVKRVVELVRSGLRPVTALRNSPFDEFAPSTIGRSCLSLARG